MPIVFYTLILILFVVSLRFKKDDGFLDHNSSDVIKGLFILMIVLHHILLFFPYSGFFSGLINNFRYIFGQLLVTMFFFISGYGIMISITAKGNAYSKTLFTNRFLRILIYTAIALVPCFIYSACVGKSHDVEDYFLAFIGLRTFGNSGWFVFAILVCYLLSSIVYIFNWKNHIISSLLITLGIIVYIIIMYIFKKSSYWTYDTIIAFPIGLFASLFKKYINSLFSKKKWIPFLFMVVSLLLLFAILYLIFYNVSKPSLLYVGLMIIANAILCIFFISLTKTFTLKSVILSYFGRGSFAVYIMHLLVVNMFIDLGSIPNEHVNYLVMFISAVSIGIPMQYVYKLFDNILVSKIVVLNKHIIENH